MPTTLRLFFLLMLGIFGLQPVGYGYDAPVTFVSEAGYAPTTNSPSQTAPAESDAQIAPAFSLTGSAGGQSATVGQIANLVAAESDVIAARQAVARNFYETNTNWDAARIDSHLTGIDFTQPVDVVMLTHHYRLGLRLKSR